MKTSEQDMLAQSSASPETEQQSNSTFQSAHSRLLSLHSARKIQCWPRWCTVASMKDPNRNWSGTCWPGPLLKWQHLQIPGLTPCIPKLTWPATATDSESDTEFRVTAMALQFDNSQPYLLCQFERMLTKALRKTLMWAVLPQYLNSRQMILISLLAMTQRNLGPFEWRTIPFRPTLKILRTGPDNRIFVSVAYLRLW